MLLILFFCWGCAGPATPGKAAKTQPKAGPQERAEQNLPPDTPAVKADRILDVKVQETPSGLAVLLTGNGQFHDYQFSRLGDYRFSLDLADIARQSDLPALPTSSRQVQLTYAGESKDPSKGLQILGDLSNQLDHYEIKSAENSLTLLLSLSSESASRPTVEAAPLVSQTTSAPPAQKKKAQKPVSTPAPSPQLVQRTNASQPAGQTGTTGPGSESLSLLRKNYTGKPISFDFLDVDLRNALRLIAELTGANIVIEPDVTGKVTLKVNQVPWDQVLDLILVMNGLAKEQTGSVIRIARQAKLQDEYARQAEQIKSRQDLLEASKDTGEIVTEYITVNYAPVAEVATKIAEAKSPKGKLSIDERTSLIIYSDYPARIENARQLISRLDKATAQVMIEARIVTMSEDLSRSLGIRWSITANDTGPFSNDYQVNYLSGPGSLLNFNLGRIIGGDMVRLDFELSALETTRRSKVIAAPKVLTINNVKAVISQGSQVPYLQLTGENVASVIFKDAVVELAVTPHITPDRKVRLEIEAKQDEIGATVPLGTGAEAPSINSRKIQTELLVDDGNIIVIGGVIRDNLSGSTSTTPGLDDIPILGRLFRRDEKRHVKEELLIFINPKIVELSA